MPRNGTRAALANAARLPKPKANSSWPRPLDVPPFASGRARPISRARRRASKTPWWRDAPWHVSLHPWDRRKKKLRKRLARRGAGRAGTASARSAATTSASREGHTAAELQRGGASHPPTGAWSYATEAATVGTCSAGCDVPCSAGCDPCNPQSHQVLVAEYIKGSCGISPARATVSLTEMERRARARARRRLGGAAAAGHARIARCKHRTAGATY